MGQHCSSAVSCQAGCTVLCSVTAVLAADETKRQTAAIDYCLLGVSVVLGRTGLPAFSTHSLVDTLLLQCLDTETYRHILTD